MQRLCLLKSVISPVVQTVYAAGRYVIWAPVVFPGDGNFMNQSGDVKLDASIEYRTRLFWKFRGAVFVDAGNIWTLRDYKDQPGGKFEFNKFYKQIAVAYGLGPTVGSGLLCPAL